MLILAGGRIVADGSAERARPAGGAEVEVRWSRGGERFVHATADATDFVRACSTSPANRWSTWRSGARASRTPTSTWCNDTRPAGPTRPSAPSRRWCDGPRRERRPRCTPYDSGCAAAGRSSCRLRRSRTSGSTSSRRSWRSATSTCDATPRSTTPASCCRRSRCRASSAGWWPSGSSSDLPTAWRWRGGRNTAPAKAVPHGLVGYFSGQLVLHSASLVPPTVVILVPSFLLFDDLMAAPAAGHRGVGPPSACWPRSRRDDHRLAGSRRPEGRYWGMLRWWRSSGSPGSSAPWRLGWVQVIAQVSPTYWLGLGMRSAFLPDARRGARSAAPGARG